MKVHGSPQHLISSAVSLPDGALLGFCLRCNEVHEYDPEPHGPAISPAPQPATPVRTTGRR